MFSADAAIGIVVVPDVSVVLVLNSCSWAEQWG